jgi:hypothetical protein
VAVLFKKYSITGADFGSVRHRPASSAESKDWFQLLVKSCGAEVTKPTKVGINPFDEDSGGQYRCRLGDLIGLSRLSEVSIDRLSYNGLDIVATRQFLGRRVGLLRPQRLLLISPKLQKMINEEKLKGFKFEIAHLA